MIENKNLNHPTQFIDCKFGQVSFKKTKFFKDVSFQKNTFKNSVDFSDCRFFGEANFANARFEYSDEDSQDFLKFNNSKFKKQANFSNVYFEKDTYFHRCTFYGDLQIYRSRFDSVANFYSMTLNNGGIPNFSACVFKNPKLANLVGVDLTKIQKKDIEDYIRRKAKKEFKQEKNNNRTEEELRVQHAKNIKDSFRVVKDVLLTQNNGLEAQVWHKIELYAKEIEIEFLIEENQQNKKSDYAKPDLIFDKSILYFYRLISDHHNNFSKILNVTLYTIVFHSAFIWGFHHLLFARFFSSVELSNSFVVLMFLPFALTVLSLIVGAYYSIKKKFISVSFSDFILVLFISCFTFLIIIPASKEINKFLCGIAFSIVCTYFILFFCILPLVLRFFLVRTMLYVLFVYIFIFNPNTLNPLLGVFKENPSINIILRNYIETNNIDQIQSFLNKCDWTKKRFRNEINDYLSLKNLLLANSNLFLKMCSKEDDKAVQEDKKQENNNAKKQDILSAGFELILIKNEFLNQVLSVINIVYLIMLVLCIFSLQKTARKNSIIPT